MSHVYAHIPAGLLIPSMLSSVICKLYAGSSCGIPVDYRITIVTRYAGFGYPYRYRTPVTISDIIVQNLRLDTKSVIGVAL